MGAPKLTERKKMLSEFLGMISDAEKLSQKARDLRETLANANSGVFKTDILLQQIEGLCQVARMTIAEELLRPGYKSIVSEDVKKSLIEHASERPRFTLAD